MGKNNWWVLYCWWVFPLYYSTLWVWTVWIVSVFIFVGVYSDTFVANVVHYDMLQFIVTSHRSGPNWTNLMELHGQWGDVTMLHAASTMGTTSRYCWWLVGLIRIKTPSMMLGSWMSTPGGGRRWGSVGINFWTKYLTIAASFPLLTLLVLIAWSIPYS